MGAHHHHHHSHSHSHSHDHALGGRKLTIAILINLILTVVQILGGIASGSLSLIADGIHNLSDAGSLLVAYLARRIAGLPSNKVMTYGYGRAEILGALINSVSLLIVAGYLIYEAGSRFYSSNPIEGWTVIVVASIALVVDLATAWLTYEGSKESINMRAAFIHNVTDALASVVVIFCGVVILLYQAYWVDLVATALISLYVIYHSWHLIRSCIRTLMQAVPEELNVDEVKEALCALAGVNDLHHIHIWQIHEGFRSLEAHVVVRSANLEEIETIKSAIKATLKNTFGINHSTLEFENEEANCSQSH